MISQLEHLGPEMTKIVLTLLECAESPWRGGFFSFCCYGSVVVGATPRERTPRLR